MQSLRNNKGLSRSLLITWSIGLVLATDILTPLNDMLELVPLPDGVFRYQIIGLLLLDTVFIFGCEGAVRHFFGQEKPRLHASVRPVQVMQS